MEASTRRGLASGRDIDVTYIWASVPFLLFRRVGNNRLLFTMFRREE
jgi:hypothetical protein